MAFRVCTLVAAWVLVSILGQLAAVQASFGSCDCAQFNKVRCPSLAHINYRAMHNLLALA